MATPTLQDDLLTDARIIAQALGEDVVTVKNLRKAAARLDTLEGALRRLLPIADGSDPCVGSSYKLALNLARTALQQGPSSGNDSEYDYRRDPVNQPENM